MCASRHHRACSLASVDDNDSEALQRMNLIVKADTIGVVEAIRSALGALPQESVTLRYLLTGAGDISVSTEYSVWCGGRKGVGIWAGTLHCCICKRGAAVYCRWCWVGTSACADWGRG